MIMRDFICDDRKSPEDYKKKREFLLSLSEEEFEKYIEKLKQKEKENQQ